MGKLVIFKIGDGSFEQGFPVTLLIGEEGAPPSAQFEGYLPPAIDLPTLYEQWRAVYYYLGKLRWGMRISVPPVQITNLSTPKDCESLAKALRSRMHRWLSQPSIVDLQLELLDRIRSDEPVRIILQTRDRLLQKLPWHQWSLFDRRPLAELALYSNCSSTALPLSGPVKVLAVFGHQDGIDLQGDWQALQQLPHAKITYLEQPSLQVLHDHLWKPAWDILFFAGHSVSLEEGNRGEIRLQASQDLPLDQLHYALNAAVHNGLKLAFFNSCDGLGLTHVLEAAQVPQTIVMREPVPDAVAQKFLRYFLEEFSTGASLDLSVRKARQQLHWMEAEFPCASWLPIICQNPATQSLRWPQTIEPPEPTMIAPQPISTRPFSTAHPTAHCINPNCPRPAPQRWQDQVCPHCGTSLRLHQRYVPVQAIATGRWVETFRVYDLKSKTEQWLQIMTTGDSDAQQQFEQETQTLLQMRDRGLPRISPEGCFSVEVTQPQRRLRCRVVEQIRGQSLQAILDRHPQGCPSAWVMQWLKQTVTILQRLHQHQIIHRNLSPDHLILRMGSGELAIAGLAGEDRVHWGHRSQSPSHAEIHQLSYRSREQITTGKADPSTDFYALGMIAIQLLTGRHPNLLRDGATGIIHWRTVVRVDRRFAEVIDLMVHPDPHHRPATATGLLSQLETLRTMPRSGLRLAPTPQLLASQPNSAPSNAAPTASSHHDRHGAPQRQQNPMQNPMQNPIQNPIQNPMSVALAPQRPAPIARPIARREPLADLAPRPTKNWPGIVQLGSTVIHSIDHIIDQSQQILYTAILGAMGSAIPTAICFWLIFLSPIRTIVQSLLNQVHVIPTVLILALASLGSSFTLTQSNLWHGRNRLWLTIALLFLGYGGLWSILPHDSFRLSWIVLSAIAALTISLSLGLARSIGWHLLTTVMGSSILAGLWYRSVLWLPGFQSFIIAVCRPQSFLPNSLDWLATVGLLAGLGAIVGLWLGVSHGILGTLSQTFSHRE